MKRIYIVLSLIITSFAIVAAENPEIERLMQEGIELHSAGDFESAIEKYHEVLQINPDFIPAIYEIALSYLAMGEYENAIRYTSKVIYSLDRTLSVGAYAIQSEALAALDRTDEAIALLERALEIRGSECLLHFNLALNFYKGHDLENTLMHVKKAIDLNKSHAEAFLLYAYVLNDLGLWVQSILAFQMFLLFEPDDHRSREAFEELLQTMRIVPAGYNEDERLVGQPVPSTENPPLTVENGVNQFQVYNTISAVLSALREEWEEDYDEENGMNLEMEYEVDFDDYYDPYYDVENGYIPMQENPLFIEFIEVNREIILLLNDKNNGEEERSGVFWTFYVPFFTRIVESEHYETFARYISVSFFPESFEWWQEHPEEAELFVTWFEEGDESYYYDEYYDYYFETDDHEFDEASVPHNEEELPTTVPLIRPGFFQRITSSFR